MYSIFKRKIKASISKKRATTTPKQHPIGNIHFSITHEKSNVEIQNSKELQPNQTIRQQLHTAKVIEDQIIQTLNQEALTQIIQVSIKEYLHQLIVAVKKQKEAKKN